MVAGAEPGGEIALLHRPRQHVPDDPAGDRVGHGAPRATGQAEREGDAEPAERHRVAQVTVRSGDNEFARGLGRERRAAADHRERHTRPQVDRAEPDAEREPQAGLVGEPERRDVEPALDADDHQRHQPDEHQPEDRGLRQRAREVGAGGTRDRRREDLHQRARTRASATVATAAGSIAIIASAAPPVTIHWPTQKSAA